MPETLAGLTEQRTRWFQGFVATLIKYRRATFREGYGWFGNFALPVKWVDAAMPVWGAFTYLALIRHGGFADYPVPLWLVVTLVLVHVGVDAALQFILFYTHQRHMKSRLKARDRRGLLVLVLVNMGFQRVFWYVYSFRAYGRLWRNVQQWGRLRRQAFTTREATEPCA